jgi:arabinan endo-1,5-alpha-L-arabinosidase
MKYLYIFFMILLLQGCDKEDNKNYLTNINPQELELNLQTTYKNPVYNQNFADPTILKAEDGFYYGYGTNSSVNGKEIHIQVIRSKNLIDWKFIGDALPEKPTWASHDFWAPHVLYDNKLKTYFLYYSGEMNSANGKCLGVATSKKPEGPFIDKGEPLLCGEGFVNIDPMAIDDLENNSKLLFWGSGFKAIKVQELAEDRINFKKGSEPVELVQPLTNGDPNNYENLIEGAWITHENGYYYLYYSGDNCCGDRAHYAVMIARSKNASGPYESYKDGVGINSNVILEKNENYIAPGHNSIVKDASNQEWIVYHAIDVKNKNKGRIMLLDRITYVDGWPQVDNNSPSINAKEIPVIN